jgi:oligogalacturonide lyase
LSLLPAAAWGFAPEKNAILPSEIVRYLDPATEFPVVRLTDPAHTSYLPSYYARAVARKGGFLLYSNDRSGTFQLYRLDLKNGQSHQITSAEKLEPRAVTLMPDEKSCCYVADGALIHTNLSGPRERPVYRIPDGFENAGGLSVSEDGLYALLIEKNAVKWRLRLVSMARGSATTVVESDVPLADASPRPHRSGLLYRRGERELHVVNYDGAQNQNLRVAAGGIGPAMWSADGRTVEYLSFPEEPGQLNTIREYVADTNEDRLVAKTTQYAAFGQNSDSSVFVGASRSKASPYLLLLVRSVKRELTLCEHKCSDPALVAPIFSPSSQRVYFQTDRHGKPAIYSMNIERLVEQTE